MSSQKKSKTQLKIFITVLVVIGIVAGATVTVSAATTTEISLTPESETADVGDSVTYDIKVNSTDNGVNSYEFQAAVNDTNVAEISSVSLQGTNPDDTLTSIEYSEDRSSVTVAAGVADHDNGVIASVTVKTNGAGTAQLGLSEVSVGDESAESYTIDRTNPATITVQKQSVDVSMSPERRTTPNDGLAKLDVVVAGAESGVSSYSFDLSIENASVATIENISVVGADVSDPLTEINVSDDGSSVSVSVGAGDIEDGTIGTIQVRGDLGNETTISLDSAVVGDDNGTSYGISALGSAQITVRPPPEPVVQENEPTDTDGDGTFEDMNGDGTFDIVDVHAAFSNRESPKVQNNKDFFDYNGDGEFNVVDVNLLLSKLVG